MLFSLQADIETLRDELEFKNHKIDEYENMLQAERHRVKDLGQELQVLNPYQYYYYYCLVTIFSYMAVVRLQNLNISAGKQCSRQVTSLINNDNNRYRRHHHHHYCNDDNNNNYCNDHDHVDDDDDDGDV